MSKLTQYVQTIVQSQRRSLAVIYAAALISFGNIFRNQFILDDFSFIVDWPLIRSLSNFPRFFVGYVPPPGQEGIYTPLKTFFHSLTYQWFGLNVFGHHAFSLLIHCVGIFLVYKIVLLLTQDKLVTFLAAFFFALHPVHCESITSITASIDTIGAIFLLTAFYCYALREYAPAKSVARLYSASLLCAILAIATHELAASLPLLIFGYNAIMAKQRSSWVTSAKKAIPFVLVVLVYLFFKYWALGNISRGSYLYDNFYLTMLVSVKALAKYVFLLFFPVVLTHNHVISEGIYSFDVADFNEYAVITQSVFDLPVLGSLLVIAGLIYVIVSFREKKPLISFAVSWFFLTLLPAMNIIPSSVYFAERYLYVPSVAFCLLMGLYFKRLYRSRRKVLGIRASTVTVFLVIAIGLAYGARVAIRNTEMKDEISVFLSAVKANPKSALMRNDLGIVYTQYGQPAKAIESFRIALALKEDPVTYFAMAEAYTNMGQNQEAEISLRRAIELDPEFADAYYNLASLYAFWGKMAKAQKYLKDAMFFYQKRGQEIKAERYKAVFKDYFGPLKDEEL